MNYKYPLNERKDEFFEYEHIDLLFKYGIKNGEIIQDFVCYILNFYSKI